MTNTEEDSDQVCSGSCMIQKKSVAMCLTRGRTGTNAIRRLHDTVVVETAARGFTMYGPVTCIATLGLRSPGSDDWKRESEHLGHARGRWGQHGCAESCWQRLSRWCREVQVSLRLASSLKADL